MYGVYGVTFVADQEKVLRERPLRRLTAEPEGRKLGRDLLSADVIARAFRLAYFCLLFARPRVPTTVWSLTGSLDYILLPILQAPLTRWNSFG